MSLITCQHCGRSVEARAGAKFCSPACRVRAHQLSQANNQADPADHADLCRQLAELRHDIEYLARKVEVYERHSYGNSVAEKYLDRREIGRIFAQADEERRQQAATGLPP